MYDESGNMLRPWAEAGFTVYNIDILNDMRSEQVGAGVMHFIKADLFDPENIERIKALDPRFISSFPPCTDLAACGAKHFANKREEDPDFQIKAMQLFRLPGQIAEELQVPWFSENPRSMVSTLWRKPDYKFNPWEYGGYLPEDDVHPRWPQYLPPRDAYPKETWIWSGNWFVMPKRKPVEDVHDCYPGWKKLGGKSAKTKQIRSETPRGFARAVFEANAERAWR